MLLIYFLIIVFLVLIIYHMFFETLLVEGLENSSESDSTSEEVPYKPYNLNDPNNALILAQQNAGNIDYLKQRMDGLSGTKERLDNMQENINSIQTQVDALVQQQADYAQSLAGSEPAEITGTEGETIESAEATINNEEDQENQQLI